MALTPKNPRLVAKKSNGVYGKGRMGGSSPKSGGHPVGGRGLKSSRGGTFKGKGRKVSVGKGGY